MEQVNKLEKANMAYAKAKAKLLAAQLNRSVMRHSLREHYRKVASEAGEKVTEARLDDQAVSDTKYQETCQAEVTALLAEGETGALAKTALCEYEISQA